MENQSIKVEVNVRLRYQDPAKGCSTNKVEISQIREVEELLLHDKKVSSLGTYPSTSLPDPLISLDFQNFKPNYVLQHLVQDLSQPGSLLMIIVVKLTHKEYVVKPRVSAAPSTVDQDSCCAICLEIMSESETKALCQLPNCPHLFHEQCLIKWLGPQQYSCPLCRQEVYN